MPGHTPIPLTSFPITPDSPEFAAICGWPFTNPYVQRLLRDDIPQRVRFGHCRIWIYRDPDGRLVGFGTLDHCDDYAAYTSGLSHSYIPLLAVDPTIESRGYGTSIVHHLIEEATVLMSDPATCHDVLFLDVYESNKRAIRLYTKCDFRTVAGPFSDPQEGGQSYVVMAKRIAFVSA
jgi:ribosomal protein S18 acetylase RimI-like enzyme